MSSTPSADLQHIRSVLGYLALFALSLLVSFVVAYDFALRGWFDTQFLIVLPVVLILKYLVFSAAGQPQRSWRYAGDLDTLSTLISATVASTILAIGVFIIHDLVPGRAVDTVLSLPPGLLAVDWLATNVLVMATRLVVRTRARGGAATHEGDTRRKIIIGAGDAGETLLKEIQRMPVQRHEVVGFLDDAQRKQGTLIHGVRVLGQIDDVRSICARHDIAEVLIAIPSAPQRRIRHIVDQCEGAHLTIKIVPGLAELIEGTVTIESQLRHIRVEDLLQRPAVELDRERLSDQLQDQCVMVTGAGGSIGSELCRQILHFQPRRLVLVEGAENNLFDIERELADTGVPLSSYLADICDRPRMERIFEVERPDIVCHAAAHKHVPIIEAHPAEGIKNNIVGTRVLAEVAAEYGVSRFVFVSTDKAINPSSVMGCTKRVAEMFVQALNKHVGTQFMTVRFGNVLGSRGSVVPIFQEQLERGGPLTVTHPDMTRYFMTIPEAAQLVLQAGVLGGGGEIFLLDMGEPVRIVDLARTMITLSGLTPNVDVDIVYTGLRPGEKLHEELCLDGEHLGPTAHPNVATWHCRSTDLQELIDDIDSLTAVVDTADDASLRSTLARIVPEYTPHGVPPPEVTTS